MAFYKGVWLPDQADARARAMMDPADRRDAISALTTTGILGASLDPDQNELLDAEDAHMVLDALLRVGLVPAWVEREA